MSHHVFFAFSSGLSKPIIAPKGTKQEILAHVAEVEESLGLKTTQYLDNPKHWDHWTRPEYADIDDKVLCRAAQGHNDWVRWLYRKFGEWQQAPVVDGEPIGSACFT